MTFQCHIAVESFTTFFTSKWIIIWWRNKCGINLHVQHFWLNKQGRLRYLDICVTTARKTVSVSPCLLEDHWRCLLSNLNWIISFIIYTPKYRNIFYIPVCFRLCISRPSTVAHAVPQSSHLCGFSIKLPSSPSKQLAKSVLLSVSGSNSSTKGTPGARSAKISRRHALGLFWWTLSAPFWENLRPHWSHLNLVLPPSVCCTAIWLFKLSGLRNIFPQ